MDSHHTPGPREAGVTLLGYALLLVAAFPTLGAAQTSIKKSPIGTWQFDLKQGTRQDAPRTVIVREDSSASYGTQTVRWRILGDSLALALGGEWVNYRLKMKGKRLTLSGGDLTEPVTFDLMGPPTPRPDSVAVPPDPDLNPS